MDFATTVYQPFVVSTLHLIYTSMKLFSLRLRSFSFLSEGHGPPFLNSLNLDLAWSLDDLSIALVLPLLSFVLPALPPPPLPPHPPPPPTPPSGSVQGPAAGGGRGRGGIRRAPGAAAAAEQRPAAGDRRQRPRQDPPGGERRGPWGSVDAFGLRGRPWKSTAAGGLAHFGTKLSGVFFGLERGEVLFLCLILEAKKDNHQIWLADRSEGFYQRRKPEAFNLLLGGLTLSGGGGLKQACHDVGSL